MPAKPDSSFKGIKAQKNPAKSAAILKAAMYPFDPGQGMSDLFAGGLCVGRVDRAGVLGAHVGGGHNEQSERCFASCSPTIRPCGHST